MGICVEEGCKTSPSFNVEGKKERLYCAKHKKSNMVNLKRKRCYEKGCKTEPSFNVEGEKKRLYCAKHKKSNMVNLKQQHCYEKGCKTEACFNYIGEKGRLYCAKHKKSNMVNLNYKRCVCGNISYYNYKGETQPIFCSSCKKNGMLDVTIKLCEHGIETRRCKHCGGNQICQHDRIKSLCVICGGGGICEHNKRRTECLKCKGSQTCQHGKHKRRCNHCRGTDLCNNTWCETRKSSKYEGFCMPCFVNNPENRDKPAMKNFKTKEKEVVDRIRDTFPDYTWIADKQVQDACSRRRPDLLLDLGTHIIIIEVDENKHSNYDCACENKRLMEISKDLQHRPIVLIRFNPDSYKNEEGILVKSCWRLNQLGVMTIVSTKQKEWQERLNCLKYQVQYWINNRTDKTIETIQLFY